jgi:carbamoyltransferase
VKANQRLWESGVLKEQWIYPDPGDSGLPVGCALFVHQFYHQDNLSKLQDLYHGPSYSNREIREILDDRDIAYEYFEDIEKVTAKYLAENKIIGWFQGRMEAGPRALGNRSIIMSPVDPGNKDLINDKVKFREPFRPFCPSLLEDSAERYLRDYRPEHFMVTSFEVSRMEAANIPAVVHVDGTVRPQMVTSERNPRYHNLITEFGKITGHHIILNTSFNVKGEPIVCNPREAIKCFYDNGLDVLVLGNYLVRKKSVDRLG